MPLRGCLVALALGVCASGCASYTALSQGSRGEIERDLTRAHPRRFLKLSFYVTPFFGNEQARLLTAVPPDEVRLLNSPSGKPMSPGEILRIVPVGTAVVIDRIAFPTSLAVASRMPTTPRTRTWVYLHVASHPGGPPLILVLPPNLKSSGQVKRALAQRLTERDPSTELQSWPESVRRAVRSKKALLDMTAEQLEAAWGYPERIAWQYVNGGRKGLWTWPSGNRTATLLDGRVSALTPQAAAPTSLSSASK